MQDYIANRCILIARYILETGATVRQAAEHFQMSKSSVHKDMDQRLKQVHTGLYRQVQVVLSYHKAVRHLRGGQATARKYLETAQKGKRRKTHDYVEYL